MLKTLRTIHAIVYGEVQGVCFRVSTQKKALELSINGWVRNRKDGTVELQATAESECMDTFIAWLHQGPFLAKIDRVEWREMQLKQFNSFEIV